jgi:hypothetical protein
LSGVDVSGEVIAAEFGERVSKRGVLVGELPRRLAMRRYRSRGKLLPGGMPGSVVPGICESPRRGVTPVMYVTAVIGWHGGVASPDSSDENGEVPVKPHIRFRRIRPNLSQLSYNL